MSWQSEVVEILEKHNKDMKVLAITTKPSHTLSMSDSRETLERLTITMDLVHVVVAAEMSPVCTVIKDLFVPRCLSGGTSGKCTCEGGSGLTEAEMRAKATQ